MGKMGKQLHSTEPFCEQGSRTLLWRPGCKSHLHLPAVFHCLSLFLHDLQEEIEPIAYLVLTALATTGG